MRIKKDAVIIDIDGTIALMGKGEPGRRGPFDWDRVDEDDPNIPIIELVKVLHRSGYEILFVSGRSECCELQTINWLKKYFGVSIHMSRLYMRDQGDYRPDECVKLEIYTSCIEHYFNVRWVFDDRDKVVAMWRSIGLTVLQVAPGNF